MFLLSLETGFERVPFLYDYLASIRYIEELQKFLEEDNFKLSMRLEPPLENKLSSSSSTSQVSSLSSPSNSLYVPSYVSLITNNNHNNVHREGRPIQLSYSFSSTSLSKALENPDPLSVRSVLDVRGREFKERKSKFYLPTSIPLEDELRRSKVQEPVARNIEKSSIIGWDIIDKEEALEAFALPPPPPKIGHRRTRSVGSNVLLNPSLSLPLQRKSLFCHESKANMEYSYKSSSDKESVSVSNPVAESPRVRQMSSEEKPGNSPSSSSSSPNNKLMTQSLNESVKRITLSNTSRIRLCLMDDSVLEEETHGDSHMTHFDSDSNPSIIAYEETFPLLA